MKHELKKLLAVAEPYGTWVAIPTEWPDTASRVFDDEMAGPFGREGYWKGRHGVFFKEGDPCGLVEEIAFCLNDADVDATLSATLLDADDHVFCRYMTVLMDPDGGFELVEIAPADASAALNMTTDKE